MELDHLEQVRELETDIESVRGEVGVVRSRLDRHLEIYAANGKEMKRMADILENLTKKFEDFDTRTKPIVDVYNGVLTVKSIVVGLASVLIALGAIGTGVFWVINSAIKP